MFSSSNCDGKVRVSASKDPEYAEYFILLKPPMAIMKRPLLILLLVCFVLVGAIAQTETEPNNTAVDGGTQRIWQETTISGTVSSGDVDFWNISKLPGLDPDDYRALFITSGYNTAELKIEFETRSGSYNGPVQEAFRDVLFLSCTNCFPGYPSSQAGWYYVYYNNLATQDNYLVMRISSVTGATVNYSLPLQSEDYPVCASPATVTGHNITRPTGSSLRLDSWTAAGNADGYVVKINNTNSFSQVADDFTLPTSVGTSYSGSGEQIIYTGTSTNPNLEVTGLAPGDYYFNISAYNECYGRYTFNVGSSVSEQVCGVVPGQVSGIGASLPVNGGSLVLNSFTAGANADGYVAMINTTNSFTAPTGNSLPPASTIYTSAGQQVFYNGTSNVPNSTVTNLQGNESYFLKIFGYTLCDGNYFFDPMGAITAAITVPKIQNEIEGNNTAATALAVENGFFENARIKGTVSNGDTDWWIISRSAFKNSPDILNVLTSDFTSNPNVEVNLWRFIGGNWGVTPVLDYELSTQVIAGATGRFLTYLNPDGTGNSQDYYALEIKTTSASPLAYNYYLFDNTYFPPCNDTPTAAGQPTITETGGDLSIGSFTASSVATGYVIKVNTTNSFTNLVTGLAKLPLSQGASYTSGEHIMYVGDYAGALNATISNLAAETPYYFKIYPYVDCNGYTKFDNTGGSVSATSCGAVPGTSSVSSSSSNSTTINLASLTSPSTGTNIAGYAVIISDNSAPSYVPANGASLPTANLAYAGSGDQVVYVGASGGLGATDVLTNVNITGLTGGTPYYLKVFGYSQCGGFNWFESASPVQSQFTCGGAPGAVTSMVANSTSLTSAIITSVVNDNTGTLGAPAGYVIKFSETNSFVNLANMASLPSANTVYAGPGEQVVFAADGSSPTLTVTGLSNGVTYYAKAFPYYNCDGTYIFNNVGISTTVTSCDLPSASSQVNSFFEDLTQERRLSPIITSLPADAEGSIFVINSENSFTPYPDAISTLPTAINPSPGPAPEGERVFGVYGSNFEGAVTSHGLLPGTLYYYRIYSYLECAGQYYISDTFDEITKRSLGVTDVLASGAVVNNITETSMVFDSFTPVSLPMGTPGEPRGYFLKMNTVNSFTPIPFNSGVPASDPAYTGGDQLVMLNYAIGSDVGLDPNPALTITGTDLAADYYFSLGAMNDDGGPIYKTSYQQVTYEFAVPGMTLTTPGTVQVGDPNVLLGVTTNTQGALSYAYASGPTGTSVTSNGELTVGNAGEVTINVSATANGDFLATTKPLKLTVAKGDPVITWTIPADIFSTDALNATQLNANANVAGSFTYYEDYNSGTGVFSNPITSGVTMLPDGNQTIYVDFQPTDGTNYNNAVGNVTITVIPKTTVTIALNEADPIQFTFDGSQKSVSVATIETSPGIAATPTPTVNITYAGTGGTTYSTSATAPTDAGTYTVTASVDDADPNFTGTLNTTLTIDHANATLTMSDVAYTYNGTPRTHGITGAESSPGMPIPTQTVQYSYAGTNGTTYGPSATGPTDAGDYIITAILDLTNGNYQGSTTANLTINKASQLITFNSLPTLGCGETSLNLAATTDAIDALTISYASDNLSVATISGNTVNIIGMGTANITSSQAGSDNYLAAADVSQVLTINTSNAVMVDAPADVNICNGGTYMLPALTNGNYYTGSGGTGMQLSTGAVISATTTLYVYAESGTTPNCTDENSFIITIENVPAVDVLNDVTSCEEFTLPTLTNGDYFTATNGGGMMLTAGQVITSTQTIYIYTTSPTAPACSNESSFTVTIAPTAQDQAVTVTPDVGACAAFDATVSLNSSQTGIDYFLRDDATDAIITGPVTGTGSAISFAADNVSAAKTYNVVAVKSGSPLTTSALNFDGTDDYAVIPGTALSGQFASNQITLETWAYIPSSDDTDSYSALISQSFQGTVKFTIFNISGTLYAGFYNGAWHRVDNITVPKDQWIHVAATYDQTAIKLYINGVEEGSVSKTIALPTGTADWYLGKRWDQAATSAFVFGGKLAETRIWNVARSATEILNNKDVAINGAQSNLVAHYNYGDGSGLALTDQSGNGYNATLTNFAGDNTNWVQETVLPISTKACFIEMSTTPSVTFNAGVSNQMVNLVQPNQQSAEVSISNSEGGVDYYLRDNASNVTRQGPITGTGSQITFPVDNLTENTTYHVLGVTSGSTVTAANRILNNMDFDGTDDYIVAPTAINSEFSANRITLETWAYIPSSDDTGLTTLIGQEILSGKINFALYVWDGTMYTGFYDGGWTDITNITYPKDQWIHVAATYDQTNIKLYIDGAEVGSTAATAALPSGTTGEWRLGRRWDGAVAADQVLAGNLAETRIWNVARTQAEVQATMNTTISAPQTGLVVNYNYTDGSGTTVTDASGNGHNGTMINMAGDATNWKSELQGISCGIQMTNTPSATFNPIVTISNSDIDFTAPASLVFDGTAKTYSAAGIGSLTPALPGTELDLTYEGRNGTTYASSATAPADAGDYTVTATVTATNTDYTGSATQDFSITPADITVTADAGQTKVYGAADPANYAYSLTAGTLYGVDALSGNATRVTGENVGGFAITQGTVTAGANYNITFVSNDFAITRAVITIAPQDATITYGVTGIDNNMYPYVASGFQFSDDASVLNVVIANASVNIVNAASPGNALNSGIHTGALEWNGRPVILDNSGNYVVQMSGVGDVTVNAAQVGVTAEAKSKGYDGTAGTDPALTYTVDRSLLPTTNAITYPDPFVFTGSLSRAAGQDAGTYGITQGGLSLGGNYAINFTSADFTINQVILEATADFKSMQYAAASMPALTISYTGFVNGEDASVIDTAPTASTSATLASNAGDYSITLSGGLDNNYQFNLNAGTFRVEQRALTVTVQAESRLYGAANPTFTLVPTGFVNGETVADLNNYGNLFADASAVTNTSDVGNYTISVQASGTTLETNYNMVLGQGTLTINPLPLTITPDAGQSKAYGQVDPVLTYTSNPVALIGADGFSGALSRVDAGGGLDAPGTYNITAGTLQAGGNGGNNYAISLDMETFEIASASTSINLVTTPNPVYTGVGQGATATANDINGDPTLNLLVEYRLQGSANPFNTTLPIAAGTYDVRANLATSETNYSASEVTGTFTIDKAPLTATLDAATIPYGTIGANNHPVTFSGFVNGETDVVVSIGSGHPVVTYINLSGGSTHFAAGSNNPGEIKWGATAANNITAANYDINFVNGDLSVSARPINITADNRAITYGTDANSGNTVTFEATNAGSRSGLANGETVADFTGTLAFANIAQTDAGTDAGVIIPSGYVNSNYAITYVNGDLTINKAQLTVKAQNLTRTYGAANPAVSAFEYSGFAVAVDGTDGTTNITGLSGLSGMALGTIDAGATATSPAGSTHAITVNVSGLASTNYSFASDNSGTLTINPRAVTVTVDAGQTKVYGQSDPANFTYTPSPALETGDNFTGALTRVGGESVNTYAIQQGTLTAGSNYSITFNGDVFSITPRGVTVTVDASQTKVYGQADPGSFTYTPSPALETGDSFTGALTRVAGENVNTYAIQQGTLSAGSNYSITFNANDFSITPRGVTVTVDAGQTKVYGQADPANFTYTPTPALETGDSFTGALTRVTGESVNTYAIQQGTLTAGSNYSITFNSDDFSITPRGVTVTVDASQTKVYGQADPANFTYTPTPALETGDSFTGALNRVAGESVNAYAIQQGTLSAGSNYSITFNGDDFSITPRGVTVTVDASQTKVYGQADPASFTYTPSPALETGDNFTGALTRVAGEHVSTYAIQQGTLTAGINYSITFNGHDFSITPRGVTVTVDASQTKVYGQSDPASFTYTPTPALETGDSFTGALTRVAGENVNTYAIQQGTLTAGSNYSMTFIGDDFSITQTGVTVIVDANQTKVFGQTDPASYMYTVLPDLETGDNFTGALTRVAGENAGIYAINQGSLSAGSNYAINFISSNFAITTSPITITADDQSKTVGQADPALTHTITSGALQFADVVSGALARVAGETANTYAINQGTLDVGSNYDLTYVPGTFTITNKLTQTITFNALSDVTYGDADFNLSATGGASGNAVTFVSSNTAVATVTGSTVTIVGAGTTTITASQLGDMTYADASDVNQTLTVLPRALTVAADAIDKVYGDSDPTLTHQVTAGTLVSGDALTGALTRVAGEGVNTYAIQQGTLANSNYAITYVGADLTINKRTITVTADHHSKTYGDADPALTHQVTSGALQFSDVFSGSLARAAGEAAGAYAINQGSLSAGNNYDLTYVAGNMQIGFRTIQFVPAAISKTYGEADPALEVPYTSITIGSLAFDDVVTITGNFRDAGENVGSYQIKSLNANFTSTNGASYAVSFMNAPSARLIINPRAITVTADAQSKTYGDNDPVLTHQVTSGALQFTDALTGTLDRVAGENTGTYMINQGILSAGGNYTLTYIGNDLTIDPIALAITADDKTKVLSTADPVLTYTQTSGTMINGDILTGALTRVAGETLGDYAVQQGSLTAGSNYSISFTDGTLTITNKLLQSITFNALSNVTYGDADFTINAMGGMSGNPVTFSGDNSAVATVTSNGDVTIVGVGTVNITANQVGNATYADADPVVQTLTVNPAALTITADNQSAAYGDAGLPALSVSYSGFVNSETASVLTSVPVTGTTAMASSDAGAYPITVSGAAASNYTITHVDGTMTIDPATLTVTADDQSTTFGDAIPTLTLVYAGFVNSEDETVLSTLPSSSTVATSTSSAGTYAITVSGAAATNYTITEVDGTLTVNQATLSVTADDQSKTYGEANPALTVSYSGFVNGDDASALDTAPSGTTTATSASSVGTYSITASGGVDNNYTFSYTDGTLTVNQAALSVTADDQSKNYGDANPTLSLTYSGFENGDDETSLTTAPTASTTATSTSSVDTYAITASGGIDNNYTFSYTDGTLTVNQAALSVTADDQSKNYGDANPTLSLTYTGFVNGDDETSLTTAPTASTTATSTSSVDTYAITASGGIDNNYTFSYTDGTLTINQATLSVTADDQSKTYGNSNPSLTLTYAGFVNGEDATSLANEPSVTTSATSTSSVSTYAITTAGGSDANYSFSYTDGTLTINQATLSVTADDQSKTYGNTNPGLTLTYSGFVNGDDKTTLDTAPTASTGATTTSDAGAYSITVGGGSDTNYAFSYIDGTLTINKANQTITFEALADQSVGDADFDLTAANSSGLAISYTSSDETVAMIMGSTVTVLNAGTTTITASQIGDTNFNAAAGVTQSLTVNSSMSDQTIKFEALANQTYGANPFELAATANSGLAVSYASSDATVATVTGNTVTVHGIGTTTITANQAGNDRFTAASVVSQTLTVDQATLTISANDQTKVYGEANPTFTLNYIGFVNGEDASALTTTPTITTDADNSSGAGTYEISVAGGNASNYTITTVNGTLTVTKASLTITADDQVMTTGAAVPTLTTTIDGLVNGDVEADLDVLPAISTTATSASPSGLYNITLSGGEDNNYELTLINGTLRVETVLGLVLEQTQIMIYPNPVVDKLYIDFPQSLSGEEITVQLFDIEGRKLQSKAVEGYGVELDVRELPSGILILQMSADGEVIRKRVRKD